MDDFTNTLSNLCCSQLVQSSIRRFTDDSIRGQLIKKRYMMVFLCWRWRYKLGSGAQTWLGEECTRRMERDGIDGRQSTRGLDASNPPCWCGRTRLDPSWQNLVGLCSQLVQMPPVFTEQIQISWLGKRPSALVFQSIFHINKMNHVVGGQINDEGCS